MYNLYRIRLLKCMDVFTRNTWERKVMSVSLRSAIEKKHIRSLKIVSRL
jgi:hypothetical protein